MRRRQFLKLAATSATGAVLFTGCGSIGDGHPPSEFKIESPVWTPNDFRYGRDAWFATAVPPALGGYGIVVRVFEGRAKKVEGNPDFPVNRGRSCARAQALVQEGYHPDRVGAPLRLAGPRGSGQYQVIGWEEALEQVAGLIRQAPRSTLLVTEPLNGALGAIVERFVAATGIQHAALEPDERVVLREAMRRVFGSASFPTLDLANARVLVSFSADFLHGWISPVQFTRAYGAFRQGRPGVRGTYYHVGPRLSGTAANADRWFPTRPGAEGLVALAMAQVVLEHGMADQEGAERFFQTLGLTPERLAREFAPAQVAEATGLTVEQIEELGHAFGEQRPSVAIAGTHAAATTNGLFNLVAVFALNYLVGSVGTEGGVLLNPGSPLPGELPANRSGDAYRRWVELAEQINGGQITTVLVHRANPVYHLPPASGFQDALRGAGAVVSCSSFLDETAMLADLVLPDLTLLEQWGLVVPDPGPGYQAVTVQQPVVNPFVDARAFGDVLIQLAAQLGRPLPWPSQEEAVRALADALRGLGRGNVADDHPRAFFVTMQAQGGWWDEGARAAEARPQAATAPAVPEFAGDPVQFPFALLPYPSHVLGYGEFSHLPWLQGLWEPISTNVWGTWVEVNPRTAQEIGVQTGDLARLVTPQGSAELPVYVNPAAMPGILSVPMGQGHTAYGRYAERRGVNPVELVVPQAERETGALAWVATRCRLEPTGKRVRIARMEGMVPAFQLEEFPIVKLARPKA
jgi:anaerobic selenocysteine-containing dehydrogenase